ncbi:MAG TPA: FtsX-like permease family protein, partial [Gemmatimonadales bacterium]
GAIGLTQAERDLVLRASPAVIGLAGREGPSEVSVAGGDQAPRRYRAEFVTGDYFATLGLRTPVGRGLSAEDNARPGGRTAAVISAALWRSLWNARPDVLGQLIRINGVAFTVVGVAPAGFRDVDHFDPADLWLPQPTYWAVQHFSRSPQERELTPYRFVVRLRRDATFPQAQTQLAAAVRATALADTSRLPPQVTALVLPGLGFDGPYGQREGVDRQLALVMGVAGLMLLVTCANVANLLLFRRLQRRADLVVRLVLGASRGRLVRYFLTESAVIGAASAVLGAALAVWLTDTVRDVRLLGWVSMDGIHLDWRVLLFAGVTGVTAAILAGILPAALAAQTDLNADLRASGPTQVGGAIRVRSGLAVLQVAVSLTLVAGGYLLARTLESYHRISPGFDPRGVTVFAADARRQGYTLPQTQAYYRALGQRLAAIPGVTRVALMSLPPFSGITLGDRLQRADAPPGTPPLNIATDQVSGEYFAALGIPLLRGTTFTLADQWPDSTRTVGKVILSAAVARKLFGAEDPVGSLVEVPRRGSPLRAVVVGVAGDIHWNSLSDDVGQLVYEPPGQWDESNDLEFAVQARIPAPAVVRAVEDASRGLDASLSIRDRGPLADAVAASLSSQTLMFRLVGLLSVLTLVLTAVGVFALVAYGVTTRTREFGLRMALGADARDIVRVAVRPALTIVSVGILAGVGGALYLTRFIAASLYGVSRFDPAAFIVAALVLGLAVLLASWLPARRAAKVDPMVALRYE